MFKVMPWPWSLSPNICESDLSNEVLYMLVGQENAKDYLANASRCASFQQQWISFPVPFQQEKKVNKVLLLTNFFFWTT